MSVQARPLAPPQPRLGWPVSAAGWAALAGLLAVVEAAAAFVDWKVGLAVVLAVFVTLLVLTRPAFLLPVAGAIVFLEDVHFMGMAVTRIFAPAALLFVVLELIRGTARVRAGAPLALACAYVAWAIASGVWTVSLGGTEFLLQSLVIALAFTLIFAALPRTEDDVRRLLYVLGFTAALMGGLSVIAFGSPFELPGIDLLQAGRSQGGVGDPDFFAAMQLVAVPLVLVAASETTNRRLRLGLFVAVLTILASVFTSLSRGAFLAVAVLGLLFLVSRPERLFRSRHEKAVAVFVVVLGMVAFFSRPYVREEVVSRAETIYAPKNKDDASGSGRTNLWKAAAKTAAENPFTGIGYGAFGSISQELLFKTPGVDLDVQQIREEGDYFVAHNTYLGTAAELGLTGLLLYLGLMIATALPSHNRAPRPPAAGAPFVGRVAHALLLGLASWAVTSFFLSGETARMFWIIVGLSLALSRLVPRPEQQRAGLPATGSAPDA
jgi:O-antigen ligase